MIEEPQAVFQKRQEMDRASVHVVIVNWNSGAQLAMKDVYAGLVVAALNTSRIGLGTGVTNAVTRHPTITANASAAIDEISHGRAILGLGAGDSALYGIMFCARKTSASTWDRIPQQSFYIRNWPDRPLDQNSTNRRSKETVSGRSSLRARLSRAIRSLTGSQA